VGLTSPKRASDLDGFFGYTTQATEYGYEIRTDLGEVEWSDVDWIGLAQDRNRWRALVNSVLNLRVP
jgi:hypothetical protein